MKHDLETFLLFSLARELAPFRLQEHVLKPPSLEAFYYFPGILTDFNSLPPASLSLVLLHFNCDFHAWLSNSFSFNLHKMFLRHPFAISSQAPTIWKDTLFITSVWRFFFFAANGKSVFFIIAASFAPCTIVATDEELHSCRIHNIRIDTTANSYEGTTRS